MEAREQRKRHESEEEEEEEFDVDDEFRDSKRKWWQRAYSLLMRSESGIEGSTNYDRRVQNGGDIVRSGITVASRLDRLVIHPDNW